MNPSFPYFTTTAQEWNTCQTDEWKVLEVQAIDTVAKDGKCQIKEGQAIKYPKQHMQRNNHLASGHVGIIIKLSLHDIQLTPVIHLITFLVYTEYSSTYTCVSFISIEMSL